jgi:hypothetical protein
MNIYQLLNLCCIFNIGTSAQGLMSGEDSIAFSKSNFKDVYKTELASLSEIPFILKSPKPTGEQAGAHFPKRTKFYDPQKKGKDTALFAD